MKRILLLLTLFMAFTAYTFADEITFSFILGSPVSLTASTAGLTMGDAVNIVVSDATTGVAFPLFGTFTASTGAATSWTVAPTLITARYSAGGANSVSIVDAANNPLITGVMDDRARFVSAYQDGRGAFLSTFDVTAVDPAVLALFGLGPTFQPLGVVAVTFGHDNFDGTTVTGQIGGGTVTIETVSEPATLTLAIMGFGFLGFARLRKYSC